MLCLSGNFVSGLMCALKSRKSL